MVLPFLAAAGGIALLDIVLSGDNALVVGAAASRLPRRQRRFAIFWGAVGAIVVRLVFTASATLVLDIPLVRAVGAVVLLVVAIRVLRPASENAHRVRSSGHLLGAILTIVAADITMSLDNVLAVAALAAGNVTLLIAGLLASMVLLFVASAFIARLMERLPVLIVLAALMIAWTAADLFTTDPLVRRWLPLPPLGVLLLYAGALMVVALWALAIALRAPRRAQRSAAAAAPLASAEDGVTPAGEPRRPADTVG